MSFKFSRKKKAWSGEIKMASGWSMRRTRTRPRISSFTTSQPRCSGAIQAGRPDASPAAAAEAAAGRTLAARRWVAAAWATAFLSGSSSTWRSSSSSRASRPAVSVTLALARRSRSSARARCTGARRGWAARSMRCCALLMEATSGCTLPVSWACCCARRTLASMSTTRFSSRERERLCISSSSWLRCRATSLSRVSCTARRADDSCASSLAWRARARASMAWRPASWLCCASACWMLPSFCHSSMLPASPMTASTATSARAQPSRRVLLAGAVAVPVESTEVLMAQIL